MSQFQSLQPNKGNQRSQPPQSDYKQQPPYPTPLEAYCLPPQRSPQQRKPVPLQEIVVVSLTVFAVILGISATNSAHLAKATF